MRASLIESEPLGVRAQMALDEAVLRLSPPGACRLRFYRWPERRAGVLHAVTFGRSQRFAEVADAVRRRCAGITFPVVRRCTGGGIVYHDGDITFSFVFPWTRLSGPALVYRRVHMAVQVGLKTCGVASRLWAASTARVRREAFLPLEGRRPLGPGEVCGPRGGGSGQWFQDECFAGPEPEDLVDGRGRKFLGGALRRRSGMGLYQGSMRVEGTDRDPESLRRAVLEGFGLEWETVFDPGPPPAAIAAEAERLRLEKYSQDLWNKRR